MIVDVKARLNEVDFAPSSVQIEIIQNVKTILTTIKRSVPMDREFGVDPDIVDLPIGAAQARLSAEIIAAVHKYEPRARVVNVVYTGSEEDGRLNPTVRIEVIDDGT